MTSFLYLGLRRFHRVFVFRTSKQNIMADPKARTDIKAEMKTEPLDSQDTKSVQDLTIFVQNLLQQMQDKFSIMSDQILVRIDEMGKRVDELEKNIGDLMKQAEADEPDK